MKSRFIFLPVMLLLAACDNASISQTLGLDRTAPDEFTVVSRPPLSVPPEFSLRPPKPGEPPRGASAEDQAHGILLGQPAKPQETIDSIMESSNPTAVTPVLASDTPSGAAANFLKRAGADKANEDIRDQLGKDASAPVDTSKATSLVEKLGIQNKEEPVVDPTKETERLITNKEQGKPLNEGEVPVLNTKPTLVDKLF